VDDAVGRDEQRLPLHGDVDPGSPRTLAVRVLDGSDCATSASARALTRASFLRRVVLGASATSAVTVAVLGLPPGPAASTPSMQADASILNFLLLLERTQEAFYAQARLHAELRDELRQLVDVVGAQERAHVGQLTRVLGGAADPPPVLELASATADAARVSATAVALEDLVLAGYNGQVPNLTPARLRPVLRIASVEARHAAWARDLAGELPASLAADKPAAADDVRAELRRTRLLVKERP
jgi:rubrerythrin